MKVHIEILVIICIVLVDCIVTEEVTPIEHGGAYGDNSRNASITAPASAATRPQAVITTTRRPILSGLRFPCSCQEGECGCCTGYILDRFNQKGCINITYDPDDFSVTAYMSMNGKVLYRNSISGKNPPPLCVRVPRFPNIKFCVEFSNIYFANRNVHLCIDAEANWQDYSLLEWSFDCIRMGVSGFAVVPPEEGGGLPSTGVDVEDQTDEDYDDAAKSEKVGKQQNALVFHKSIKNLNKKRIDPNNIKLKKLDNNSVLIYYKKQ
ncbi:uncharacterized protein LOC123321908 [Coccinella septempunctata]|uniref:uncharacterized protein LOC123321908 n=1 Tax=Coccinella septempunctata TaxID=41139 RepID=UPI001D07BB06|nr:uncharacterized protein LOC123321908 [Coccinella septempunctata]